MSSAGGYHRPVMADEAVGYLITRKDGVYIDTTAGGGSHTLLIVSNLGPLGKVLAIDRDDEAVARTSEKIEKYSSQVVVAQGNFADLKGLALKAGIADVNGILFDLGVSSHQLDTAERGFSYRESGPLDFRMDRRGSLTAAEIINKYPAEKLARIFFEFGEEKNSRKIASAIVTARKKAPLTSTAELAGVISSITNPRWINKTLSRVFQAIRLVVNDEINQLKDGLEAAVDLLGPQGRIVVIAYHSLEDRIVKNFIRDNARGKFVASIGAAEESGPVLRAITKKPIMAAAEEINENPRARSARMRVAEKI
jgi:16S rRNA (cytosine1402-N4)-methyltransferase